ncbi:glucose dehydrogenase [FAD, quinone]-like [Sipha flava]|uniref:Glucose dehydrogenase [FAD, quinone]-like n=1 Tax=Sipha flava TaxID=143950 RepID=A0A8B8GF11_9HEMI|nr:glucose dehydrogenase [FAD, quinone]-like [Sipha flava]
MFSSRYGRMFFMWFAVSSLILGSDALDPMIYPGMQTGWSLMDELAMWNPYEPVEEIKMLPDYDFVVVGAGSAGALVANRLTEVLNWKVLLIEAGQEATGLMDIPLVASLMQGSTINWNYKTVPMNNSCLGYEKQQCKMPRGKVMGGSSVLNYMIYTRGNRKDYDDWEKMGNPGWSYDEVLKYFKKSEDAKLSDADEDYHGQGGMLPVTDIPFRTPIAKAFVNAASEIGMPFVDINGKSQIGVDYIQEKFEIPVPQKIFENTPLIIFMQVISSLYRSEKLVYVDYSFEQLLPRIPSKRKQCTYFHP